MWKFVLGFGFFAFCEIFANGCLCGHEKAFGARERERERDGWCYEIFLFVVVMREKWLWKLGLGFGILHFV